jgi:hypothetical protein
MLTKFRLSKITSLAASALLFFTLWGVIEAAGWSGSAATPPAPAAVWTAQEPVATEPPPVIVERTIIVRRLIDTGPAPATTSGAPPDPGAQIAPVAPGAAPPPAAAPAQPGAPPPAAIAPPSAPAAPPPPPPPPPAPAPVPVASTRAS